MQNLQQDPQFRKYTIHHYQCQYQLGRGMYAEVVLAERKTDEQQFAIKIIDKKFMSKQKKQYQVFVEREMLFNLKHPGILQLYQTFQTHEKLYFVIEYMQFGDFADFLKLNQKYLTQKDIQFYVGQIVLMLQFLHSQGIVHRDVKPENLLLNNKRHLKISDFGTASIYDYNLIEQEDLRDKYKSIRDKFELSNESNSLVGTAEYISPELIQEDTCSMESDLWALGCICYKIYSGRTPFQDESEFLTFQNIKMGKFTSELQCDAITKDFIMGLLQKEQKDRLGANNNYEQIKKHKFFEGLDFNSLFQKDGPKWKVTPKPKLDRILDPDLQFGQKKQFVKKKQQFIIFFGVVSLKMGWFNQQALTLVLLESNGQFKLAFYDPEQEKSKLKIKLKEIIGIKKKGKDRMKIELDNKKVYEIKEVEHNIDKWIDIIEEKRQQKQQQI